MRSLKHILIPTICILTALVAGGANASITTPLTHYSANPRYFASNGTPIVLLGAGQPLPGSISTDYTAEVDAAAAAGANYIRLWNIAVWDGSDEYYPWLRTGPGTAQDGKAKFDLTQWDPNYWTKLKGCIALAQSKNMYVTVLLFERCGMSAEDTSHRWDWNPWNPLNNVNGLNLPTTGAGIPAFYDLTNAPLLSLQELYAAKLISETSSYPNVIYETCNEYTGTWPWLQHWVDYFKAGCSNMVAINFLGQTSATPSAALSYSGVDMPTFHWLTTSASTTNSDMIATNSFGKPVVYDETPEISTITLTNYQDMLWSSFVGGGNCHLENGDDPTDAFTAVKYCQGFITSNNVNFAAMSPNNSLVTKTPGGTAFTLANPGTEYVVYISGSGSGSMTMSLVSGKSYTAKAYNPSNGTYTNLTVSGNTISGIPSYSPNIVIYVKSAGTTTASNPNITLSLAANQSTALPGSTITYTLTYKNTGAGPASNVSITSAIPASTTYVSGSVSSGGTYDSTSNGVKWSMSTLAAGASGSLTFQVKIN